jgi:putative ABC transport system permease protein
VAARLSGRRAARIRPAEALAESADGSGRLGPVRIIIGLLALAGGITLVLVMRTFDSESGAIPVSQATVILMAMAVALLGPLVTRAAASALRLLPTGRLAPRWLATAQLSASAGRVAQVVSPITLLVAMACTVLFTQDTLGDAAGREAREGSRADRVVVSTGGPGVPHSTAEAIRRTPGTGTVTEVLHTTVRTADLDNFAAQGVTPKGLRDNLDLDVTSGSVEHLGPKDAAVSRRFADTFGLEVGERHAVHLGDGTTVRVRVAAVYERAFGFGDLTLPYRMVARHVDNPLASTVLVQGGTEAAISKTLKQHPGAAVLAPEQVDKLRAEQQESSAMINYLTMGLVLAFTAIAVTNTTAMATSWRTREFALLRLVGATRRQVMRTARWEAAATALLALLLGTGISLAVLSGFGAGMTGDSMPSVPFPQYAAVVAVATVLATVSSAIPTRRALRGNPVDEVNSRA